MFVELLRDFLGKKAGERLHVAAEEGQRLIASGVAKAVADDPLSAFDEQPGLFRQRCFTRFGVLCRHGQKCPPISCV